MGYGSRALTLLDEFYSGYLLNTDEIPRKLIFYGECRMMTGVYDNSSVKSFRVPADLFDLAEYVI